MERKELIPTGKKCTTILKAFVRLVFSGNSKEAADELVKLKNDGVFFAMQMDGLLFEQETLEDYFITKETKSIRDIAECLHQLLMLKEEQVSMLAYLERKSVVVIHLKSKLMEQETKVRLKEEHDSIVTVMVSSGLFHSLGDQSTTEIDTKQVKRNTAIEYYKSECSNAEENIAVIQEKISERKSEVSSLEENLDILRREKETYHKRVSQIKEKVSFLQQAMEFWCLMYHLSNRNIDYATITTQVFKKATEKIRFISRGTKKSDHTFIEAWDSELIRAEKGLSQVLPFTFTCCRCRGTRTSMPHIIGGSLYCAACHIARSKSPIRNLPQKDKSIT